MENGCRIGSHRPMPMIYDEDPNKPIEELIDQHVEVAESLAEAAQACASAQKEDGS